MSDQEKKKQSITSRHRDAENKKQSTELNEEELKKVSGGVSEITITKSTDGTSSNL